MFDKKVIEELFNNHNKLIEGVVYKEYNIGGDIIIYAHQNNSRITMSAINEKTKRQLNLMAAKYKSIINNFKKIGVLSTDKYYLYIDLINKNEMSKVVSLHENKQVEKVSKANMTLMKSSNKVNNFYKSSKVYGYCRVSSKTQLDNNSLEQQENEILQKYSNAKIYKEQCTGIITDRLVFNEVVSKVSKDDVLVVTKLDRLARNTKEGIEVIEYLFQKGVAIHVLNIGLLENTTMGKFFLTTLLAVSEMERSMIIERTQAGKEIARTKAGFKEGRPKKFKKTNLDHALSLLTINGGIMSYKEVERATEISKSTLIRENNKRKL